MKLKLSKIQKSIYKEVEKAKKLTIFKGRKRHNRINKPNKRIENFAFDSPNWQEENIN